MTVFADHAEDLTWILCATSFLHSVLFELSIEEPLVDLDPGEASFRHGLFTNFTVQLSVVLLVQISKDLDLIIRLALAIGA